MKSLQEYIAEASKDSWLDDVDTNWTPVEGLFTWSSPKKIADYLAKHSKDERQAMARLVFYMNRAGNSLPNKAVLSKSKELLKQKKNMKQLADFINESSCANLSKEDINLAVMALEDVLYGASNNELEKNKKSYEELKDKLQKLAAKMN